jgi:hypothetical protein
VIKWKLDREIEPCSGPIYALNLEACPELIENLITNCEPKSNPLRIQSTTGVTSNFAKKFEKFSNVVLFNSNPRVLNAELELYKGSRG